MSLRGSNEAVSRMDTSQKLSCRTAFFPALSTIPVITAATTAWATSAAAAAVAAATVAAVSLSAAGRTGCVVRRGEMRTMVGFGEAQGATLRRARREASGRGDCGRL